MRKIPSQSNKSILTSPSMAKIAASMCAASVLACAVCAKADDTSYQYPSIFADRTTFPQGPPSFSIFDPKQSVEIPIIRERIGGNTFVWNGQLVTVPGQLQDVFIVPAYVGNYGPIYLALDTGAAHTVLPTGAFYPPLVPTGYVTSQVAGGGPLALGTLTVASLTIGTPRTGDFITISPFQIYLNDAPAQAASGRVLGLLGQDFLRDFRVIIDYPRSRLILERYYYNPPQ